MFKGKTFDVTVSFLSSSMVFAVAFLICAAREWPFF